MKCPGQDPMFWKPEDVFEIPCPKCGYSVEFFRYDVKRKCRCGHEMVNPRINFGCAEWCPSGDVCIEGLPEEMKVKQKEEKNNRLRERIASEMKKYFGPDMKHVRHSFKAAQYAEEILKIEGGQPIVVLGAAYLHDLEMKGAEEKPDRASVEGQGKNGLDVVRGILTKLNVQRGMVDEICDLIGNPLPPKEKETLHFQILSDADWLAKMEENGLPKDREKLEEIIEKYFKTMTGKKLARELYLR